MKENYQGFVSHLGKLIMDHVANMLNGILNAGRANKAVVVLPYSKLKSALAAKLFESEYISSYKKIGDPVKPEIEIGIRYNKAGKPKISGIRRLSKQSRRLYFRTKDIKPVRQGHGTIILTTPKGILTGKEAQAAQVGGEALFEIW